MCLIALSDNGFQGLKRSFWRACCAAFPDGLGVMYFDGKLCIAQRSHYDVDTLYELLNMAPRGEKVAVHLRSATFGSLSPENMHPHVLKSSTPGGVDSSLAVMHNGCITKLGASRQSGPSDTAIFTHTWLRERIAGNPAGWNSPEVMAEIHDLLDDKNRMVFLDSQGAWSTVGCQLGAYHEGTWLSNTKVLPWI